MRDTLKYEVLVVDEKKAKVRTRDRAGGTADAVADRGVEAAPETVSYQVSDAIDVVARALRVPRVGDQREARRKAAASISTSTCRTSAPRRW